MNVLKKTDPRLQKIIFIAAIISLLAFILYTNLQPEIESAKQNERFRAAKIMQTSIGIISDYCRKNDISFEVLLDPNETGLIGPEYTGLTTTLGQLEAKRTSTNPEMAALITDLLRQAGTSAGDKIAIGCSGSFPGLMIAALSACKAMNIEPVIILSLGSSSFGANRENFTILDIYNVLYDQRIFSSKADAISLGGANDTGDEFEKSQRENLISRINESEVPFIFESNLQKNVTARMEIYKTKNHGKSLKAFINAGGNLANMGASEMILNLKPGLNRQIPLPDESLQGVIHKMAAENIPVLHLLYIKELATSSGLMWDPVPLPVLDKSVFLNKNGQINKKYLLFSIVYFALIIALLFYYKITKNRIEPLKTKV